MKIYSKWVKKECGSLKGKNVVITGADGSIGYYISYYTLLLGANVIMAILNISKGEQAKKELLKVFPKANITIKYVDLNKLDTIRPFVKTLQEYKPDILVNNSGVYHLPREMNDYKIERTFSINYFGTSLLTQLMLPLLKERNGKIVYQTSISTTWFKKLDLNDLFGLKIKKETKYYSLTKKLALLNGLRLKRAGENVDFAHPGASPTGLFDYKRGGFSRAFTKYVVPLMRPLFNSPSKASLSAIYAMTHDLKYDEWVGPIIFFHLNGYPHVSKISKTNLDSEMQNELLIKTNALVNKENQLK